MVSVKSLLNPRKQLKNPQSYLLILPTDINQLIRNEAELISIRINIQLGKIKIEKIIYAETVANKNKILSRSSIRCILMRFFSTPIDMIRSGKEG